MIANIFSQYWWIVLLRGIVAVLFGIIAVTMPWVALFSLMIAFGAFAFADGCLAVVNAIGARKENENWWVLLLEGLLGIAVGIIIFRHPPFTALVLFLYIAIWAIATGVLRIALAVRLRKEMEGEWMLVLGGTVSVILGLLIMASPGAGTLAVLLTLGVWAFLAGISLIVLSLEMRSFGLRAHWPAPDRPGPDRAAARKAQGEQLVGLMHARNE